MDILQPLLHPPRDEIWVTQATFSLVNSPFPAELRRNVPSLYSKHYHEQNNFNYKQYVN